MDGSNTKTAMSHPRKTITGFPTPSASHPSIAKRKRAPFPPQKRVKKLRGIRPPRPHLISNPLPSRDGSYVAPHTLLLLLCTLSHCVHIPNAKDPNVPDGPPIREVRFEGVTGVDKGTLMAGLANRGPERIVFSLRYGPGSRRFFRFDELQVELDRQRIRSYYERAGYFGVEVKDPQMGPSPKNPDQLEIVWTVEEGSPTLVKDIRINGAPEEHKQYLENLVPINEGDIYSSADFSLAQNKIRAALVVKGYADAKVAGRVQIDKNDGQARVILNVSPGEVVHLGNLSAEGMVRTPDSTITNRKTWEDGEVFHPASLEHLRGRLYGIDQYASVRLDYATTSSQASSQGQATADIVARVEESEQNELQLGFGGGFDAVNQYIRARARYKRRNFPFRLTNAYIEFLPAIQFVSSVELDENGNTRLDENGNTIPTTVAEFAPQVRASVTWYDFGWPLLELETDGGYQLQQLEAYEWRGPDIGQTLRRRIFDDRLQVSLGWRYHFYEYDDQRVPQQAADIMNIQDPQSVVVLQPSLIYDRRNDPLEPTQGIYLQAASDVGIATESNTSDTSDSVNDSLGFLLIHPEARGYLPFGSRLVLATRMNLIANLAGSLPGPLRVFAGGSSSQRGFAQRRLSEVARLTNENGVEISGDVPIGGQAIVEASIETRLRLFRIFGFWFGVVGFLDAADIGQSLSEIKVDELRYAAGGGLRYLTPVGAIRLDYGYRLNKLSSQNQEFINCRRAECGAFHFSLGQAF